MKIEEMKIRDLKLSVFEEKEGYLLSIPYTTLFICKDTRVRMIKGTEKTIPNVFVYPNINTLNDLKESIIDNPVLSLEPGYLLNLWKGSIENR